VTRHASHARASLLALSLAAVLALPGCAEPEHAAVSGRVVDETVAIGAPALPPPAPTIGASSGAGAGAVSASGANGASGSQRSRLSTAAAVAGLGQAMRVKAVDVEVGDTVKAGQIVARLDDAALRAQVSAAIAARHTAQAQIDVLGARLDDLADTKATIVENRATATSAIANLTATRADLVSKLAAARVQLANLQATQRQLDALRRQMSQGPPAGVPPGVPGGGSGAATGTPPGGTPPAGQLPDPARIAAGIAQLQAGISQLESAIAQIDSGLGQARAGVSKLDSASATVADARTSLRGARRVARAALAGRSAAIGLARAQRDLAVLRTPVAGVVTQAAQPGEVVTTGQPVVTVRPSGAAAVDVWVAPADAARLEVGGGATAAIDSRPGETFPATISAIGPRAIYPPSWFATSEVHMTRAIPVRITLDDVAVKLPAGTPADVRLQYGSAK
jgi:multidrug efflux pump subunit AcrA (membrane-fusion protein)